MKSFKGLKYFAKFFKLSLSEILLLFEAIFFLFISKIIVLFPFKVYIKLFKTHLEPIETIDRKRLLKYAIALNRANKLAFWSNVCLVQSVAGRFMLDLRNIPSVLHLGLRYDDEDQLKAHAWLSVNDFEITKMGRVKYQEIFKG